LGSSPLRSTALLLLRIDGTAESSALQNFLSLP
jgi:hypothetical protein